MCTGSKTVSDNEVKYLLYDWKNWSKTKGVADLFGKVELYFWVFGAMEYLGYLHFDISDFWFASALLSFWTAAYIRTKFFGSIVSRMYLVKNNDKAYIENQFSSALVAPKRIELGMKGFIEAYIPLEIRQKFSRTEEDGDIVPIFIDFKNTKPKLPYRDDADATDPIDRRTKRFNNKFTYAIFVESKGAIKLLYILSKGKLEPSDWNALHSEDEGTVVDWLDKLREFDLIEEETAEVKGESKGSD